MLTSQLTKVLGIALALACNCVSGQHAYFDHIDVFYPQQGKLDSGLKSLVYERDEITSGAAGPDGMQLRQVDNLRYSTYFTSDPQSPGFDQPVVQLTTYEVSKSGISNGDVSNGGPSECGQVIDSPSFQSFDKDCKLGDGLLAGIIQTSDHQNTGFLDFNYYWDNRAFNVLTINAGAKLPNDFEYFQFVNFTSPFGDSTERENWNGFFTEIHLRRPIAKENEYLKHLDWNVMWADGDVPREVGRLGIRWRFQDTPGWFGEFVTDTLKLNYSLTVHAVQDNGDGWQLEHVYRRQFLDGLLYVGGFTDHAIEGFSDSSTWVSETQVGVKLVGNLYAVTEYRYTSFGPPQFRSGWGIGVEYVVPFR